jgi:putative Mn2+ efflux pump MntP
LKIQKRGKYNEDHFKQKDSYFMPILLLLLFVLPLGLDTLGVSVSLGMKSYSTEPGGTSSSFPPWLRSALLFSLAETLMPLVGLIIGYAASLVISDIMHYLGALLLVGVGLWELLEEGRGHLRKRKLRGEKRPPAHMPSKANEGFQWGRQLLLALSVSLDELAIGFSLGSITSGSARGRIISLLIVCVLIGIQGFGMALLGLFLGRTLRTRLKPLKAWTELLSAFLLIGLGIWLLVT